MTRHILIIQGHPDVSRPHYGHALADAYAEGARASGHEVKTLTVASLQFPFIHSYEEFYEQPPPDTIRECQDAIRWADHLVVIYPLWMGSMPALLKGFFEQVFRTGFAMKVENGGKKWTRLLKGKSARVIITMGMPALIYRWYFGAHSLKSLEKNILRFCGIAPVHESLIGMVEGNPEHRARWLEKMKKLGKAGN